MRGFNKKTLGGLFAVGYLALAANSAWAIPFTVDIGTTGAVGAGGSWDLTGPTALSDDWGVGPGSDYSETYDIAAGNYAFAVSGVAGGLGWVSWALTVGDTYIGPNHIGVIFIRLFHDGTVFVADAVSVPEPGSLALLGMGLVGFGFAARRRAGAKA